MPRSALRGWFFWKVEVVRPSRCQKGHPLLSLRIELRYIHKKTSLYLQIQVRGRARSGTQLHCGRAPGRRSGTVVACEPEPAAGRTDRPRLAGARAVPWPAAARAAAGDRTDCRPEPPGPVAAAVLRPNAETRRRGALGGTRRARDRGPPRRRGPDRAAAP